MHSLKSLRWLTFALGLGVALAIAGAGVRTAPGLEAVGGWSTDGTWFRDEANPTATDGARLELSGVLPGSDGGHFVAGTDERGRPVFACTRVSRTRPLRSISSMLVSAEGDTLALVPDRWYICPTGVRWPEPEVLAWWPESWYEPASRQLRGDRVQLFRHNYAREFKILHYDHFMRALRHAARGESLAVYTRLLAVVPGEEERLRMAVAPLLTADAGLSFTDGDRHLALLMTDGGYHNVDTFYMLFAQKSTSGAHEIPLLGISDIEGGYRGVFAVHLDTGEDLWTARTGVTPVRVCAADVNGDGLDEFVVQCYSSENGASGGGTTDAGCSYVFCLDNWGNVLWKKRFPGVHIGAYAAVADVAGDVRPEVVVVCSSGRDPEMGYAAVLSGDGTEIAARSDLGGLYGIAVADFLRGGKSEIVAGAPDGVVLMLDGGLNVVASYADTVDYTAIPDWVSGDETIPDIRAADPEQCYRRLVPFAAFDYDGDGDIETMSISTAWANVEWMSRGRKSCFPPRGDLVVLDSSLREEGRCLIRCGEWGNRLPPGDPPASLKSSMFPIDMDGDGVMEVVFSNDDRGLFVFGAASENDPRTAGDSGR